MTDLMLDLETVGTNPGCAIIAIACTPFNANTGVIYRDKTFYTAINFEDSMRYGFSYDKNTVSWWLKTNEKLFVKLKEDKTTVQEATTAFMQYMESLPKGIRVWGNSARFDLGILSYFLFKQRIYTVPWTTWNERDFRTIKALNKTLAESIVFEGEKHNPLDDNIFQIRGLRAIAQKYKFTIN